MPAAPTAPRVGRRDRADRADGKDRGGAGGYGPIVVYLLSFVSVGLSFGLLGPALTELQAQAGVGLGAIGILFTTQALGYLVGSVAGGSLYDRGWGHRLLGGALLVQAAALLLIPHGSSLAGLGLVFFVIGTATGVADVGGNTLLVWRRGRAEGPLLNALHLGFAVGAVVAPLVVGWSLASGDLTLASLLMAAPSAVVGTVVLARPSPEPLSVERHPAGADAPTRTLALVAVFFFLYVGVEIGFGGWVHTYAETVGLGGAGAATALTALFWGTFLLGRLLAVGVATRVSSTAVLVSACAAAVLAVGVVAASGGAAAGVWVGTAAFGLAIAPQYPSMVAFFGQHFPLSGSATSWFVGGSAVGGLTLPWLIGRLVDASGPAAMPVTVLIGAAACLGWLLVLLRVVGRHRAAVLTAVPAARRPAPASTSGR